MTGPIDGGRVRPLSPAQPTGAARTPGNCSGIGSTAARCYPALIGWRTTPADTGCGIEISARDRLLPSPATNGAANLSHHRRGAPRDFRPHRLNADRDRRWLSGSGHRAVPPPQWSSDTGDDPPRPSLPPATSRRFAATSLETDGNRAFKRYRRTTLLPPRLMARTSTGYAGAGCERRRVTTGTRTPTPDDRITVFGAASCRHRAPGRRSDRRFPIYDRDPLGCSRDGRRHHFARPGSDNWGASRVHASIPPQSLATGCD